MLIAGAARALQSVKPTPTAPHFRHRVERAWGWADKKGKLLLASLKNYFQYTCNGNHLRRRLLCVDSKSKRTNCFTGYAHAIFSLSEQSKIFRCSPCR